jgi:multidrug efflux pump subunit AcrA (membrane-fusion protein)
MVTPLKKHPGQHGGLLALALLAATTIVVWTAHPRRSTPPVEKPKPQISATMTPEPVELSTRPPVELPRQVSASGPISYDESRTAHVNAPVAGWLHAHPHGRTVRAGETIGVIHSVEVYLATQELIAQLRDFRSQALLDDVRMRLYRWGMRREMIMRIEQTMKPQAALPLIARVSGTVVAEPKRDTPLVEASGDDLVTITDPSYAWLYVEIPADQAERARIGMTARVTIEGIARPVRAPIGYISRRVSEGKRTVRFDLHTANLSMPPTAQAKVDLEP